MNFQNLEKREKILIAVCVAVGAIFITVFGIRGCGGSSRGGNVDLARIKKAREGFLVDLARYRSIRQTVTRIDERLASTPPDFDLVGTMSADIDTLGLRPAIRNLNPGESQGAAFFAENYVDIDMQSIKLDDLVSLLKKIDESKAFMRVSQLSVKKRMGEEGTLDVNIRVAAYSVKQETAP
jgi:hypothetical protein